MEKGKLYMPNPYFCDEKNFCGYFWGIEPKQNEILTAKTEVEIYVNDIILCVSKTQLKKFWNYGDKKYYHVFGNVCCAKNQLFFVDSTSHNCFKEINHV